MCTDATCFLHDARRRRQMPRLPRTRLTDARQHGMFIFIFIPSILCWYQNLCYCNNRCSHHKWPFILPFCSAIGVSNAPLSTLFSRLCSTNNSISRCVSCVNVPM